MAISLRSLEWKCCSMKMLPDNFNIQKIGFLDLSRSNIIQVWSDSYMSKKKVFTNLKSLDLSECKELVKLPDFSCSLKLEKLYLQNCSKLVSIPDSICLLKNLVYLNISGCQLIMELPNEIGKLQKLIELCLHGTKIDALPHSMRSLQKLEILSLNGYEKLQMLPTVATASGEVEGQILEEASQLRALLDFIGNLKNLSELRLCQNMLAKNIPDQSVGSLTNLEKLQVGGALRELPNAISNLTKLCELDLSGSNIELLPESIGFLQNMKILNLEDCKMLKCLPESIGSLTRLEELNLGHCDTLRVLPSSIGDLRKLRDLVLAYVPIEELPNCIQFLESLTHLNISHCDKLETVLPLWELKSLERLTVGSILEVCGQGVANLVQMSAKSPHTQECRTIDYFCTIELADLWFLSITVGDQKRVIFLLELNFQGHTGREWLSLIFPNDFVDHQYKSEDWSPDLGGTLSTGTPNLHCVRVIDLSYSDMEELDESIVHLPNLKQLYLSDCKKLKCLPSSFGCLTRLAFLSLWGCESLTALPDSIGGMTNLYSLLLGRSGIKEFPSTMKSLCGLCFFNINACVKLSGGLPLLDLEGLEILEVEVGYDMEGEEVNEEVPDDMVEMSGYSEQLQQFRRIRFMGCGDTPDDMLDLWEFSITTGDHQERVIRVWENVCFAGLKKWQWLRLIFPEDFDREQRVASWATLSDQLGQHLDPNAEVLTVTPMLQLCEIDIQRLPDTIGCLQSLRILRLHECKQLTCLPESIGYLTRLGALDLLGCTSLLTLPNSIGNLTKLETLALVSCTSLASLPNSVGNLKRLWLLNLTYSSIEMFPDSFPLLESLRWLYIIGCDRLRGRLPLWEMKCLEVLVVGGEGNQKVEGDDEIGEGRFCEIPDGITHYSQQAKEYRRFHRSSIQDDPDYVKRELSIWVDGSQEREIKLLVFPPCEGRKGQPWLRHVFPDGFTPQYDTRTRSEASASHSFPLNASAATEAIVAEEKTMIGLESEPLVSLTTWYDFLN
ncbi:Disease resistance protein [Nymphaea thermarum]|nr:Disease resistance protein [Nymphaea thermarum]